MTCTDKKSYKIATEIIEDIFWKKYENTIIEGKPWYDNLNDFLVEEWIFLKKSDCTDNQITQEQDVSIVGDAIQILIIIVIHKTNYKIILFITYIKSIYAPCWDRTNDLLVTVLYCIFNSQTLYH